MLKNLEMARERVQSLCKLLGIIYTIFDYFSGWEGSKGFYSY